MARSTCSVQDNGDDDDLADKEVSDTVAAASLAPTSATSKVVVGSSLSVADTEDSLPSKPATPATHSSQGFASGTESEVSFSLRLGGVGVPMFFSRFPLYMGCRTICYEAHVDKKLPLSGGPI